MKKNKTTHDIYGATDKNDNFGRIYKTMLENECFVNMSILARYLLILCRAHSQTKECRRLLYKVKNDTSAPDGYFVITRKHLENYGIHTHDISRYFNELENNGFIEVVEQNKYSRLPNIYKFSEKWKCKQ